MPRGLRTIAVCAAAIVASAVAQEEQQATFVAFEATDEGGILRLSGGTPYGVPPKAVYDAYRGTLNALVRGSVVAYQLDANGRIAKIRLISQDDPTRRQVRVGRFQKLELEAGKDWAWIVLGDDERYRIGMETYQKSPLPVMKRGAPVRLVVEKGMVVQVTRGQEEGQIPPEDWERIQRSKRQDPGKINGREYKFLEVDRTNAAIKASPRLPDGTHAGVETIKLDDVHTFENPSADERAAANPGEAGEAPPTKEGDTLVQWDVRVGDTIGLGLDIGQVVSLAEDKVELRLWKNETWGPVKTIPRLEIGTSVRRASLPAQTAIPLQGGEVHLRVQRTRHAAKGGLVFECDVDHDLADQVLVGAKVKFNLSANPISSGTAGQRVEEEVIPVLFAGQQARLVHRVVDEVWLDGWAELSLDRNALVPLTSPGAKAYLLTILSGEARDLNELTKLYEAAGGNGDEDLVRILIERAIYPPPGAKYRSLTISRGTRSPARSRPAMAASPCFSASIDSRNLKRAVLERGELRYEPLNRMKVEPGAYRKELVRLLGRLPGSLKGEHGQKLFTSSCARSAAGRSP